MKSASKLSQAGQVGLAGEVDTQGLIQKTLAAIFEETRSCSQVIPRSHKERYGQYFTPSSVAAQMASMLDLPRRATVGDYGAGTGILGATALCSAYSSHGEASQPEFNLQAFEIDDLLHHAFGRNLGRVADLAVSLWQPAPKVSLKTDFTGEAPAVLAAGFKPFLDAAILNPPYKKLDQSSDLAKLLRQQAVPTPNLYAVFILLAVVMLKPKGQLVAIVPRSFCNGDYFRPFRKWLRAQGAIDWFVRYQRRSNVFRGDNVLQENIIFRFRKGIAQTARVRVSLSIDPEQMPVTDSLVPARDVMPEDDDRIYVPATPAELSALDANRSRPCTLADLGLEISTGKIEEFRYREHLTDEVPTGSDWVPLVYAQHWERGSTNFTWSPSLGVKQACLRINSAVEKRTMPAGHYVLLKRISANDDRTGRCHPCVIGPGDLPGEQWAFENHIQVIAASQKGGLTSELARGLANFLASQEVNLVLKTISGTTQLNCTDLRQVRFPKASELASIEQWG